QPEHVVARRGAHVWRLQNAAVDAARRSGVVLRPAFAPSRQPDVGGQLNAPLDAPAGVTGPPIHHAGPAAALPTVLRERGVTAPTDLSVIGRYSDEFARTFSLPYSSIESAPDRLGRMAVRELVRRIEGQVGPDEPHVVRFVSPELVDRGSTATPPEV